MAIQQQQPAGGLNQVAPRPAAPPAALTQPQKNENLAARAAGMEQEQPDTAQDYFTRTIEERQKQSEALMAQIERLKSSLDSRKGLPFDPVLMAGAAGFLKPTKTGSFGESLGYAAEGMSSEAEKEFARRQATAKLEMELGEKGLGLLTKNLEAADLLRMSGMGGKAMPSPGVQVAGPGGIPSGAPVSSGAPAAPAGGAPAGVTYGQTGAINQMYRITDADIARAYSISKEHGDKIKEIAKLQREDVKDIGGRPYSTSRQEFLAGDPNKPVEHDFGIYIGPKKTTAGIVETYERLREEALRQKDPTIITNFFKRQGWLEGDIEPTKAEIAEGKAKPSGKPSDRPPTLGERAIEKERSEAEAKEVGKGGGEAINALMGSAQQAVDVRNLSDESIRLATANPKAFKLMQNADVRKAYDTFLQAVRSGVQTPWGGFSLPGDVLAKHNISPSDYAALQKFAQVEGTFTLLNRRTWLKGQGAVSNAEGQVAAQIAPLSTDRPEVIRMKAEAVTLKANFEEKTYMAYEDWKEKNPSKSFGKFLVSDDFKDIRQDYTKKLQATYEANQRVLDAMRGQRTTPAPATPAPAAPAPAAPARVSTPAQTAPVQNSPAPAAPSGNTNRPKTLTEQLEESRRKQAEKKARGEQ